MIKKKYKKLDYNTEDLESLSNSDLKKVADYWLRQYLLKNSENVNGKYLCPIKNKWYTPDKIQVCHYIDRGYSMWNRYFLKNCHLMSEETNCWDSKILVDGYKSKHHKEYQEFLIEKYGQEEFDKLTELSKEMKIFYKEDYIEIIKKFRNE
jgi:hypothetical protein